MKNKSFFYRFFGHLKTINTHKFLVMKTCFKCGMYKQGLLHDLSKYSFTEFWPSVKYFQGDRSPIGKEKEVNGGYSLAWLHHKGRNKHHWEYWVDRPASEISIYPFEMPVRYMLESVIDRICASKVYMKDKYDASSTLNFFINSKEYQVMNPKTVEQITYLLQYLKDNGEEKALAYYKSLYKKHKNDKTISFR